VHRDVVHGVRALDVPEATPFLPGIGAVLSSLRKASMRRLFSFGDTTRPPSVISAVFSISLKPAMTAVS